MDNVQTKVNFIGESSSQTFKCHPYMPPVNFKLIQKKKFKKNNTVAYALYVCPLLLVSLILDITRIESEL
jgi:hypothetical protein